MRERAFTSRSRRNGCGTRRVGRRRLRGFARGGSCRGFGGRSGRFGRAQFYESIDQLNFSVTVPILDRWAVRYAIFHSFETDETLGNTATVEYVSKCRCWAFRFEVADDRRDGIEFNFRYRILGIGDDHIRPFSRNRRGARDAIIDDTNNLY